MGACHRACLASRARPSPARHRVSRLARAQRRDHSGRFRRRRRDRSFCSCSTPDRRLEPHARESRRRLARRLPRRARGRRRGLRLRARRLGDLAARLRSAAHTGLVVLRSTLIQIVLFVPIWRQVEMARLWPVPRRSARRRAARRRLLRDARTDGPIKAVLGAFLSPTGSTRFSRRACRTSPSAASRPTPRSVSSAACSAALPAIPACCRRSGRSCRGWPKEVARGVYQPFILFAHVLTFISLGSAGIDRTTLCAPRREPAGARLRGVARLAHLWPARRTALPQGARGAHRRFGPLPRPALKRISG